jgi:hypothetical protein
MNYVETGDRETRVVNSVPTISLLAWCTSPRWHYNKTETDSKLENVDSEVVWLYWKPRTWDDGDVLNEGTEELKSLFAPQNLGSDHATNCCGVQFGFVCSLDATHAEEQRLAWAICFNTACSWLRLICITYQPYYSELVPEFRPSSHSISRPGCCTIRL